MIKAILFVTGCAALLAVTGTARAVGSGTGMVTAAGDDVRIRLGGTIQPRVTFGSDLDAIGERHERAAFGMRRLRVRLTADFGDNLGVFLQMEGSGATPTFLDIRGEYKVNDHLTMRAGRFVGAQPRAFARTLHSSIDAIDRPAISDMWANMTLGADGRDYGVEALWNTSRWEFRGFLHNGFNRWNYNQGISRNPSTGGMGTDGFAFSAAATHWPGGRDRLEIGAYASVNTAKNERTEIGQVGRNYISYSAHAYWGPLPGDQPLRIKTDFIGISYQEVAPFDVANYIGTSLFTGLLLASHVEVYAMGEYWYGDGGGFDSRRQIFATAGASYSLSALAGRPFTQNRIMLAYSVRSRETDKVDMSDPAHVVMVQMQFLF